MRKKGPYDILYKTEKSRHKEMTYVKKKNDKKKHKTQLLIIRIKNCIAYWKE